MGSWNPGFSSSSLSRQSALRGGATRRTRAPRMQSLQCDALERARCRDHRRRHGGGDGKGKMANSQKLPASLSPNAMAAEVPAECIPTRPCPLYQSGSCFGRPAARTMASVAPLCGDGLDGRDVRLEDRLPLAVSFELYAIRQCGSTRLSKSSKYGPAMCGGVPRARCRGGCRS